MGTATEIKPPIENPSWKKKLTNSWWILLILIPLIITLMVRLEPMKLVPLERSAESNVLNYYRSSVQKEIESQFPNIPAAQKAKFTEQKLQELLETQKSQVEKSIGQSAKAIKSRLEYESGAKTYVYLGDLDSYYWLRQSRNIIEKGDQCDVRKDGKCYDSYTLAPNLREKQIEYYPEVIVMIYKILKVFNKDMSLMQASFLTPLVFALIFTIPLFLLLRKIGNNLVAIMGTVLVSVSTHILGRSLGSDSDILNVFFQIFFLWLAIECFYADSLRTKSIWAALVGILLSVYSLFWSGWWYLADLFIMALLVKWSYLLLQEWRSKQQITWKGESSKLLLFQIFSFAVPIIILYGMILFSLQELVGVITGQISVLTFKVASNPNYWPNVLTTVAEFNGMGISSAFSSFGAFLKMPLILMAILGMVYLVFPNMKFINKNKTAFIIFIISYISLYYFIRSSSSNILIFLLVLPIFIGIFLHSKTDEVFHPDMVFLLAIIICMVSYFTVIGARFLFLMAVPVSILVALFIERTSKMILITLKKLFSLPSFFPTLATILIMFLFLIQPVKSGFATAQNYVPMMSDDWVATLEKIRDSSKPDAIINSWWDFGHWFKYWADRRVTLDGASQNNPQLHWLGKLLLTSDENTSIGILRMLDCGGNNAFDTINAKINDTPHSIYILNQIIPQTKGNAKKILEEHNFSDTEIEQILYLTHCSPPENFLIASEDMIGKSGVWAHFGSWNFNKAYLSRAIKDTPQNSIIDKFAKDYDISEEDTRGWIQEVSSLQSEEAVNAWIAPWPSYYTGFMQCEKQDGASICEFPQQKIKMSINFDKKQAIVQNPDGSTIQPSTIAYVTQNSYEIVKAKVNSINLGVIAIKSGDQIQVMYMDPALVGSMFTRLFFFDGLGLNSFEKFYDTTTVFGERIITYKVKWPSS